MPERVLGRLLCAAAIAAVPHLATALAFGAPGGPHPMEVGVPRDARHSEVPAIADTTWVDADGRPIPKPPDWEPNFYGTLFREIVADPIAHTFDIPDKLLLAAKPFGVHRRREAANVNAFDEVPNSSWFTNRNHVRAVPVADLLQGPDSTLLPEKPWTITHPKHGGASAGFQIKDAAGRKWLVKLDWHGHPQLSSGADMVARTLLHAAGYAVPHNEPVRFVRGDVKIDDRLLHRTKGERFTNAELEAVLAKGAVLPDGSYSAMASLFVPGHALGSPSLVGRRPGDLNDWYRHQNRREMRGLYVISSWLGFWDTKDANFLDSFVATEDSLGHVEHYLLDPGSSFGADANGVKRLPDDFEGVVDFGWIARRIVTLGFVVEPWRRAHQETGIPSIGRFESDVFDPGKFVPGMPDPDYREMTDADAYWGAKIVASFSDAQIEAAVDAAHYEDPRARDFLVRCLIQRRDKIARYWFRRIAPLDYFTVRGEELRFHDLGVDIGLARPRSYDVEIEQKGGAGHSPKHVHLTEAELPLRALEGSGRRLSLEISVSDQGAKGARVELTRKGAGWAITRVRHG